MARITVEDCLKTIPNRFELVLAATYRARQLVQGHSPRVETLSEYRMVKILGADCVGMSTVPEVIVARHIGLDCFGISVITDMGDEANIDDVSHAEVLIAAEKAEPAVRTLIKELILQF